MGDTDTKAVKLHKFSPIIIVLCISCVLVNFAGVRLALGLNLPVFLDSVGTILAGALGGYMPGIIVGFVTNLINGISDEITVYYGVLNVLIAIAAAFFSGKGYFNKWSKIFLPIITFSVIGGAIGSILTWLLFGLDFGTGISAPFAKWFYETALMSKFQAQFTADILIDLLDKTVTVVIVVLVLKVIPKRIQEKLHFYGWRQAPLSKEDWEVVRERNSRSASLRLKMLFLLGMATLMIGVVIVVISFILFHNTHIEDQNRFGHGVTNVIASIVDPERMEEYQELGESAPGYYQIESRLQTIMDSSADISQVYVAKPMEDGVHILFAPGTLDKEGYQEGQVIPYAGSIEQYREEMLAGAEIDPIITDKARDGAEYLIICSPVFDKNDTCQYYAAMNISMNRLRNYERMFLIRVIALFVGVFFLILAVGVWLAEYNIIIPINSMAVAADAFAYDTEKARTESTRRIKNLKITTGDEIENLYHALIKTSDDTAQYIVDAQTQTDVIAKLQNGLIMVLADLVESRDECTGNHVRNTANYVQIIVDQLKEDGVYTDQLTDEFMFDVVNSAPLHDLGKIRVPDAILNKPGKLTDEEFAIMKEHAAAGGDIISRAIDMVSEENSGYLKEAINLATYHHEKWNGSGYPSGLSGEEIPLSARIMAVADVFDALISRRSYKEGFSFEKSMAIIREGSGSHFDPNIVEAFLHAEDKVRIVAEADKTEE